MQQGALSLSTISAKLRSEMGHMANDKIVHVATHGIPQMAVALVGSFVYARGVGQAARSQGDVQNRAEQHYQPGGVRQTPDQASEMSE